ncbi:sulfurtransferase [Halomonas piscis]|uniref:Sulfurtransferase n=1 Tax=Halomonas piscis TaxID=3031727 RepID=A0ABY9Z437_9GAMM|nr:sulfurtransferase [Halomonas piscis]WNK21471.1 sulfurtransferase [Halomonas piscis]
MSHPLISAAALDAALAGKAPPLVLDCRARLDDAEAGERLWGEGHVPGARYVALEGDLAGAPGAGGRHPLPSAAAFTRTVQRLGITPEAAVVVYDDRGGQLAAARAWWMLAVWADHPDVRVLDGGLDAWKQRGGALVTATQAPTPSAWQPRFNDAAWVGADTIAEGEVLPVDARAPARFRGESEPVDPVAGHIPGAHSRPGADNLTADGYFKPAAVLDDELPRAPAVAAYCGSGITACHNVLAYAVAGRALPALYAGSWSEWITVASRPVATGESSR